MAASLAGKVVIITGAGGGLGKIIAKTFIAAGATTVIVDVNPAYLSSAASELGESAHPVEGDVTSEASVQHIFDETMKKFGRVDVLVNNAGLMDNYAPVGDVEVQAWERIMGVNITGPMLMSRAAVKHFLARETPGGVILNVSSLGGLFGNRAGVAYTASKHAIIGLTKNTAAAYHKKNIRCNVICPGAMPGTNIVDAFKAGVHKENQQLSYMTLAMQPNMLEVGDVANVCLFLCSDMAKTCSGAVVTADGGWGAF